VPALLLLALLAAPSFADADIRPIAAGLSPLAAERLGARVDARTRWVYDLTEVLRLGYRMPDRRPEIFLVSRKYIVDHEREVCFQARSDEERRYCAERVYGWTDDQRRLYVLRGEDVQASPGFPAMEDFPADLWVEMAWTHELAHYVQLEGSPHAPSRLPCEVQEKWEGEAFLIGTQWLHSLRSVDAERLNTIFRGQLPRFGCVPAGN
jgi:hypothetical protein